jgi:nucleoside-diphosphate-sugar epimerase
MSADLLVLRRILVTDSAGFLGSPLWELLVQTCHEAVTIGRLAPYRSPALRS